MISVCYTMVRRWIRYLSRRIKYRGAATRATEILYIPPDSIQYILWPGFYSDYSREYTYIRSGNWDERICREEAGHWTEFNKRSLIPVEKYIPYKSFINHFSNDIPWEETEYFRNAVSDPKRDRLGTVDSPRWEKFRQWDNLYHDIKKEGYKSESGESISLFNIPGDEILINIGRDGQFILDDGRHRFMIAKILEVDRIPVRILVRHEEWQNKKNDILLNRNLDRYQTELKNNPDLR